MNKFVQEIDYFKQNIYWADGNNVQQGLSVIQKNGQVRSESCFLDGVLHGPRTEYDYDKVIRLTFYEHGAMIADYNYINMQFVEYVSPGELEAHLLIAAIRCGVNIPFNYRELKEPAWEHARLGEL